MRDRIITVDLQRDLPLEADYLRKNADTDNAKVVLDNQTDVILDELKEQHGLSRSVSIRLAVKVFDELVERQADLIPQILDIPDDNVDIRRVL